MHLACATDKMEVHEQIRVFYDTLLRVHAVGAVLNTSGTRNVSRQHIRQLSGIAIGVCFVVYRPTIAADLRFTCSVCTLDRTVLLMVLCMRTDAIERDMSPVARQNTIFSFEITDLKKMRTLAPLGKSTGSKFDAKCWIWAPLEKLIASAVIPIPARSQ